MRFPFDLLILQSSLHFNYFSCATLHCKTMPQSPICSKPGAHIFLRSPKGWERMVVKGRGSMVGKGRDSMVATGRGSMVVKGRDSMVAARS